MIRDITVEEALFKNNYVIVDIRSESEYQEATIPGAVNIPLLNNDERAKVGTVYKQRGPREARRLGLELVSPRLPQIVNEFDLLARSKDIVLFCWRGGMRSKFTANILNMMDIDTFRIVGGYKSYRRFINEYLAGDLPHRAVVLHGLTGVGKTELLLKLPEYGIPVLDLEGLAKHRGSVYGKINMSGSPSQKMFESMLVQGLYKAQSKGVFVVECESKRLGNLIVPRNVMDAMKKGYRLLLYTDLENRVRRIVEDYTGNNHNNTEPLKQATSALKKYLGTARVEQLNDMISMGQLDSVVRFLLPKYYDPLYKYPAKSSPEYDLCVDTSNSTEALEKIVKFVTEIPEFDSIGTKGGDAGGIRQNPEGIPGGSGCIAGGCGRGN